MQGSNELNGFAIIKDQVANIYEFMIAHSPNTVVIINLDGEICYINEAFFDFTGYDWSDLSKSNIFKFIHEDDQDGIRSKLVEALKGHKIKDIEFRFKHQNGQWLNLLTDAVPIKNKKDEVIAILTLTIDLTERYLDKQKLKENFDFHQRIIQLSPNAIYVHSAGKLRFANDQGLALVGARNIDEIANIPILEFIHPDYRELVLERINQGLKTNELIEPMREKFIRLDGSIIDVEATGRSIIFNNELSTLSIVRDLSSQIMREKELVKSELRNRAIINAIPDLLLIIDRKYKIIDCNVSFAHNILTSREDIKGLLLSEVFPLNVQTKFRNSINQIYASKKSDKFEFEIKRNSKNLMFEARLFDSGAKEVLIIIQNITKRKIEEKDRLKQVRMESISLLAGGIAHDFNNILVGILGNVSLLQSIPDISLEIKDSLKEIESAAFRASELTQQLLTFSKGGEPITRPESIKDIIEDSVSFVLRGSKCKCVTNFDKNIPAVEVEAGQIYQLINNIVINAKQSMESGGIIRISAKSKKISYNENENLYPGNYIIIEISDEGPGIPEEIRNKIFEPYFTTKSHGTGLGLATSYSIVKRHGGHISLTSKMGNGSTFSIYLPESDKKTTVVNTNKKVIPQKFSGSVLVLDDEPEIQQTLMKMLSYLGIKVTISSDGIDAVQKFNEAYQNGKHFDLLIMDLTIPGGMGGKEALQKILEIDPKTKAIVSSGYSNDPTMARFEDAGFKASLPKPYTLTALRQVLVEFLN